MEHVVLVTNNHVLPSTEAAMRCVVYFDRVTGDGHAELGSTLFDTGTWRTCQVRLCMLLSMGRVAFLSTALCVCISAKLPN